MGRRKSRHRPQRPHLPEQLGPRLFWRGRWLAADLRPWGGGRPTLRDPSAKGWPEAGERTRNVEVAERWRWTYVADLVGERDDRHLGRPKRERPRPIGALVDRWLDRRALTVAHGTWMANRTAAARIKDRLGQNTDIASVTPESVRDVFDALLSEGYAPNTLITERAQWSEFFRWAERDGLLAMVKLPRPPEEDIHVWWDEDIERIREAADRIDAESRNPIARLAVDTALATGARRNELFALPWSAFDADQKTVRITRQLGRRGFAPLKGKRARVALVIDREWWERFYRPAKGLVVANARGEPVRERAAFDLITRILDTAKLNGYGRGWHDTRRTYGRLFLEGGGWVDELQRSLGHKSIVTTQRQYGRFEPDRAAASARERIYGAGRSLRLSR